MHSNFHGLKFTNCIDSQYRLWHFFFLRRNNWCFSWRGFNAHNEYGIQEQRTHLISLLEVKFFTSNLQKVWSIWKFHIDLTFKSGSSQNRRFQEETRGTEVVLSKRERPVQIRRVGTYFFNLLIFWIFPTYLSAQLFYLWVQWISTWCACELILHSLNWMYFWYLELLGKTP